MYSLFFVTGSYSVAGLPILTVIYWLPDRKNTNVERALQKSQLAQPC